MGTEQIYFYSYGPHVFRAMIGADVEAKPGVAKLFLAFDRAATEFNISANSRCGSSQGVPSGIVQCARRVSIR